MRGSRRRTGPSLRAGRGGAHRGRDAGERGFGRYPNSCTTEAEAGDHDTECREPDPERNSGVRGADCHRGQAQRGHQAGGRQLRGPRRIGDYLKRFHNVSVATSGTGGGFEKFCAGETDISNASRPIKADEEVPVCEKAGVKFEEVTVANDGIAVVTNRLGDILAHTPAYESVTNGRSPAQAGVTARCRTGGRRGCGWCA